ncbi:MAG: hypothetical protein U9Q05_09155, partial [Thermodesulfobacteriota bacterium]|nr:hypothetical protein [Thermodesulfobacteriota bacterium]
LNPQVGDINRIYPGSLILIPLKIITQDTLPTYPSGSVIIPFASISDRPIKTVLIRRGDTVSKLISQHFGDYGSKRYQEGIRQFQTLNPQITDLNRVMVGQKVHLPLAAPPNPESFSIVAPDPKLSEMADSRPEKQAGEKAILDGTEPASLSASQIPLSGIAYVLNQVASLLEAKLYDQGGYYFPMLAGEDWRLDLSMFPVMLLKDQTRFLFIRPYAKVLSDFNIVKSHWKNVHIIRIPVPPVSVYQILDKIFASVSKNRPMEKMVFKDGGVTVEIHAKWILIMKNKPGKPHHHICLSPVDPKTGPFPEPIFRYLTKHHITYWEIRPDGQITGTISESDQQPVGGAPQISTLDSKRFVRDLASALDWAFRENVEISFPYGGVQVDAVSNRLSIDSEHACLVDFGSFAGEGISAIEASGMKVASVTNHFDSMGLLHYLFEKLSISYKDNPTIAVRDHKDGQGVFFTQPGLMVHHPDGQALLTPTVISDEQTIFLKTRGIQTIRIVP